MLSRELEVKEYPKAIKELQKLVEWMAYKAFVDKFYPGGVEIHIEREGEYDDEGGTDYRIVSLSVLDENGDNIPLDDKYNEDLNDDYEGLSEYWDAKYDLPNDKYEPSYLDLRTLPTTKYKIYIEE